MNAILLNDAEIISLDVYFTTIKNARIKLDISKKLPTGPAELAWQIQICSFILQALSEMSAHLAINYYQTRPIAPLSRIQVRN
jgi:hypothetical protein